MKLNNYLYRTAALLLLVILTAACTSEDDFAAPPDGGMATAAPLTITVTDGAYAPAQSPDDDNSPATRAVERGYGTEFTKGDQIGLYVVEMEDASNPNNSNRTFLHENLCLTHDGTGWTLPEGTKLTYQPPEGGEILYFAYYPYRSDMKGKVDIYAQDANGEATTEARYFFGPLINVWAPAYNQSTYEAYTASDLMVAKGKVTKRTDGTDGSVLSFTMEHQMALVVMRLPTTKYTYTETIGGKSEEKSYRLYSGVDFSNGWKENSYTVRWLWNPRLNIYQLNGFYYNSSLEKRRFSVSTNTSQPPGTYRLVTIDGGEETVTNRALREGDFYMKDGTILPHDAFPGGMPADVQADCLGVVFWVGEKKNGPGQSFHWTLTAGRQEGDPLLMRDHPGCTHGLVVALTDADADKQPWSSSSTVGTYQWLSGYAAIGQEAEKELLLDSDFYFGYNMSRRLQWFRDYGSHLTEAYDAIEAFAKANPTPAGCSGWYFPGDYETTVMARGTRTSEDKNMTAILNPQFDKAGGDRFKTDGYYWSSTDMFHAPEYSYFIDFSMNYRNVEYKYKSCYVRAVLAF